MRNGSRFMVALGLLLFAVLPASPSGAEELNNGHAWFKPSLAVSESPICATFLRAVQKDFLSAVPWRALPESLDVDIDGLESVDVVTLEPIRIGLPFGANAESSEGERRESFIMVGGAKIFVRQVTNSGCGGACESQGFAVSTTPAALSGRRPENSNQLEAETPGADSWTLYKNGDGVFYVAGLVFDHLEVYRVTAPKDWRVTCDIVVAPDNLSASANATVRAAAASINDFETAVTGITGTADGDCGSARTPSRWAYEVHRVLLRALYRPWPPETFAAPYPPSENSFGDYDRNMKNLEAWALGGIYEYRALASYRTQFAETSRQLTALYTGTFQWSEAQSARIADQVLRDAVSHGMGFYQYQPFENEAERQFRAAVLEHLPLVQIERLAAGLGNLSANDNRESLLNVAVLYPDALRLLLGQGANPNVANAFGKTPLMYAAQFNQQGSAELLLEHGADPNAATTWADDRCDYTLTTAKMTPLHYAVRYGSASLVRLLLAKGAITFRQTDRRLIGASGEYPADWLKRYVGPASTERNRNISDSEIPELERFLRVPDSTELAELAGSLTLQAESEYAAGRTANAYHALSTALSADPGNRRALNDLPLIALKTGRLGESLQVAERIIVAARTPAEVAAAWFNRGLACEQTPHRFLSYDGENFCIDSPIHPFLEAWKIEPTQTRARKLKDLFDNQLPSSCVVVAADGRRQVYFFTASQREGVSDRDLAIYVYHAADQGIDPAALHLPAQRMDPITRASVMTTVSPEQIGHYNLGDATITVLQSLYSPGRDITIGDKTCRPSK